MADPSSPTGTPSPGEQQMRGASAYPPSGTSAAQMGGERIAEGIGQVKDEATRYATRQKSRMADQVQSLRNALDDMCAKLEREQSPAAAPARKLADGLDSLAQALDANSLNDLSREVQDFARRNPALFIGGAALAGFMAGRFLRSSGEHGERAYMGSSRDTPQSGRATMGSDFYAGTAERDSSTGNSYGGA